MRSDCTFGSLQLSGRQNVTRAKRNAPSTQSAADFGFFRRRAERLSRPCVGPRRARPMRFQSHRRAAHNRAFANQPRAGISSAIERGWDALVESAVEPDNPTRSQRRQFTRTGGTDTAKTSTAAWKCGFGLGATLRIAPERGWMSGNVRVMKKLPCPDRRRE